MIGALARVAAVPAMDRSLRLLSSLLPLWFIGWSVIRVQQLGWTGGGWDLSFVGRDFWIYRGAGLAVLDGADPWLVSSAWNGVDWHFAAPPVAAQLFVPFALLPGAASLVLFSALSVGAAWAGLRAIGLPAWWLLFPPMTEGIMAANPQILLFGLLLFGGVLGPRQGRLARDRAPWLAARAAAVGLKIYGIVPILARREWTALLATGGLLLCSVALGPGLWSRYLSGFGEISSRIIAESEGGLSASLFLRPAIFEAIAEDHVVRVAVGLLVFGLIATLVFLAALRDVEGAGWVAAPLLWPAAEYHLGTMAIPAIRTASAWLIAIPSIPTYLLGLVLLTWQITAGHRPIAHARRAIGLPDWIARFRPGAEAPKHE